MLDEAPNWHLTTFFRHYYLGVLHRHCIMPFKNRILRQFHYLEVVVWIPVSPCWENGPEMLAFFITMTDETKKRYLR